MRQRRRWVVLCVIVACAALLLFRPLIGREIGRRWGPRPCDLLHIAMAMNQYAADHDDRYPESFGLLFKEGYISTPKVFVNVHTGTRVPPDFPPPPYDNVAVEVLDRVHDFGDYALVRGVRGDDQAHFIIVHEKRDIYLGERGFVCNDGHRQWLPED